MARSEVERKGARQSRAQRQRAAQGRWCSGGVRPLGYTSSGDVIPAETAAVLGIYRAIERGNSMRDIARALSGSTEPGLPDIPTTPRHMHTVVTERNARRAERGLDPKPVPRAQPWAYTSLHSIVRNPVYAGYSTYRKAKRKDAADKYHRAQDIVRDPTTGEPVRGQWEPIVPADLWWRAQEILDSPDRLTNAEKRVSRKHLGSGLYICDDCGSPVRAHSDRYRCPRCGLVRSRNRIDGYVTAGIRARLARTDFVDLLPQGNADTSAVDAELVELKAKLARVQADYDSELIEARDLKRARDRYNPRISELEAERALATASSALLDTTGYDSPVAAFDASELAVQRRVLDLPCTVRLKRGTRGTRVFDPDTVVFEWIS